MLMVMDQQPPIAPTKPPAPAAQPGMAVESGLAGQQPQKLPARDAWRSEELLGDRAEVLIMHNNEIYRLRRTRQGKLILHK